jgi:hypothetical protein
VAPVSISGSSGRGISCVPWRNEASLNSAASALCMYLGCWGGLCRGAVSLDCAGGRRSLRESGRLMRQAGFFFVYERYHIRRFWTNNTTSETVGRGILRLKPSPNSRKLTIASRTVFADQSGCPTLRRLPNHLCHQYTCSRDISIDRLNIFLCDY